MAIEAVIFDMDGLMFDTERLSVRTWRHVLAERGLTLTDEQNQRLVGRNEETGNRVLVELYGDAIGDVKQFRAHREEVRRQWLERDGVDRKPGLLELLEFLREAGIPCAVASSSAPHKIDYLLDRYELRKYFRAVVSGEDFAESKPHPAIFYKAVELLGVQPAQALVLEDSPAGIEAAWRAGIPAVHIPDLIPPDETTRAHSWRQAENLLQVVDIIRQANGMEREKSPKPL
ncbi:MAG: HAD family hydrolase [Eubacteriales bacterium]|jgi:beta-phosphoglucomutase